jgi:hypothetical protein
MDERETPLRGGRTIAAIVRIEDSVRRPVGPRSAFVHQLLISLEREGFPVRHDFSGLTHRAKRYFRFCPARFRPSWEGFHTLNWLRPRAFYANFTTPAPTVNGQMDDRLFVVVTRVGVMASS